MKRSPQPAPVYDRACYRLRLDSSHALRKSMPIHGWFCHRLNMRATRDSFRYCCTVLSLSCPVRLTGPHNLCLLLTCMVCAFQRFDIERSMAALHFLPAHAIAGPMLSALCSQLTALCTADIRSMAESAKARRRSEEGKSICSPPHAVMMNLIAWMDGCCVM